MRHGPGMGGADTRGHSRDTLSAPGAADQDLFLKEWRKKTLRLLIWVLVGARSVQGFLFLRTIHSQGHLWNPSTLTLTLPLLLLLALAIARNLPSTFKGWCILGLAYLHVVLIFWKTGRIEGILPLTLVTTPLFGMILIGRRSAWACALMSVTLYGTGSVLLHAGVMPPPRVVLPILDPLQTWTIWMVIFVPFLVLQDQFIALFQRLLTQERRTRIHLQEGILERQALEQALLETSERERQSVGHELHDGVCQQITGAMLHCKAMERAATGGQPPAPESLQAVTAMLDASLGQVHDLARGLSPGTLTAEALLPALRDLARYTRETFEVEVQVEAETLPESLAPAAATHLYRIAQEALANAVKHGQPTWVRIRLGLDGGALVLEVWNDGHLTPASQEGMGLRIMRHRADLIGSTFAFSALEGDIRVRISTPMEGTP